jgi:hypothetical protein
VFNGNEEISYPNSALVFVLESPSCTFSLSLAAIVEPLVIVVPLRAIFNTLHSTSGTGVIVGDGEGVILGFGVGVKVILGFGVTVVMIVGVGSKLVGVGFVQPSGNKQIVVGVGVTEV